MTTEISTINSTQSLDRFKLLVWLAVAALGVSVIAAALLLVVDPASGSSTEAVLGVTAAIGGIATGVFVVAAAIYAQVKNLWRACTDRDTDRLVGIHSGLGGTHRVEPHLPTVPSLMRHTTTNKGARSCSSACP
jgi:hypothetical protein